MSRRNVLLLSCGLALCSLAYELIFTQILGVLFGSQVTQYNLVVSLFTCFLGLGALIFPTCIKYRSEIFVFIVVETLLFLIGLLAPFIIIWVNSTTSLFLSKLLSYSIVSMVGFLSGFELPLMLRFLKNSQGSVLAYDYLGMVGATIAIPLLCFPHLGVGTSALFVAFSNLFLLLFVTLNSKWKIPLFFIFLGLLSFTYLNRFEIGNIMSTFYLRGQL